MGGKTREGGCEDVGKGCRLGHRLANCKECTRSYRQPGGMEEQGSGVVFCQKVKCLFLV